MSSVTGVRLTFTVISNASLGTFTEKATIGGSASMSSTACRGHVLRQQHGILLGMRRARPDQNPGNGGQERQDADGPTGRRRMCAGVSKIL